MHSNQYKQLDVAQQCHTKRFTAVKTARAVSLSGLQNLSFPLTEVFYDRFIRCFFFALDLDSGSLLADASCGNGFVVYPHWKRRLIVTQKARPKLDGWRIIGLKPLLKSRENQKKLFWDCWRSENLVFLRPSTELLCGVIFLSSCFSTRNCQKSSASGRRIFLSEKWV